MKNPTLLMLIPFLVIGATATARADFRATEYEHLATIDRPVDTEHRQANKHHDGSVVMNGMTRGELDRHPNGG